jgi:hypothetical protein
VETADTGSDLTEGHGFRACFFLLPNPLEESLVLKRSTSFDCDDEEALMVAVEVEDDDDVEEAEEDEFVRWTPFRGIKIRDTSSEPMLFRVPCPPLLPACHDGRGTDCIVGSEAMAVICGAGSPARRARWIVKNIDGCLRS